MLGQTNLKSNISWVNVGGKRGHAQTQTRDKTLGQRGRNVCSVEDILVNVGGERGRILSNARTHAHTHTHEHTCFELMIARVISSGDNCAFLEHQYANGSKVRVACMCVSNERVNTLNNPVNMRTDVSPGSKGVNGWACMHQFE